MLVAFCEKRIRCSERLRTAHGCVRSCTGGAHKDTRSVVSGRCSCFFRLRVLRSHRCCRRHWERPRQTRRTMEHEKSPVSPKGPGLMEFGSMAWNDGRFLGRLYQACYPLSYIDSVDRKGSCSLHAFYDDRDAGRAGNAPRMRSSGLASSAQRPSARHRYPNDIDGVPDRTQR